MKKQISMTGVYAAQGLWRVIGAAGIGIALSGAAVLPSCAAPNSNASAASRQGDRPSLSAGQRADAEVPPHGNPDSSARPAATADGAALSAAELHARLGEAAGAVILEELALDSLIEREARAQGVALPESAAEDERQLLFQRITDEARLGQDQAGVLIDRFRRARGLGPKRFAALLERNAKLRALVRTNSIVSEEAIAAAAQRELGPTVRARILVTSNASDASAMQSQLAAAPTADRSASFATLAYERSRDPSAPRGGLFGPVSPNDPTIPASIRPFLGGVPGTLSSTIAVDNGFAILLIEEQLPAAAETPESLAAAKQRARTRQEREAMERLTADMLARARITVFDESSRWSWEGRPR